LSVVPCSPTGRLSFTPGSKCLLYEIGGCTVRNEIATAHLVIFPAHHAPLLAQEQEVAKSRSFYLRCHGVPFRDGVKADIVSDRAEIITITRLSGLMSCALHENGA
ncbi:MAG: hypothetical protein ACRDU4_05095, partial [Mycobacterium sp.]